MKPISLGGCRKTPIYYVILIPRHCGVLLLYVSFLGISDALYLEIFHQPPIKPALRQAPRSLSIYHSWSFLPFWFFESWLLRYWSDFLTNSPPACPNRSPLAAYHGTAGTHPLLKSLRMLWVKQMMSHSAATFDTPRKENRRNPRTSLIWPKTGSTICLRLE